MQNPQIQQQSATHQLTEEILVVPRNALFPDTTAWYGIQSHTFDSCITTIQQHTAFIPRAHAETNPAYKQIIPYVLFTYQNKLFVMQRKQSASEQRLASKFSLGIGGHIRQEDIVDNNILMWANREFAEEVSYTGQLTYHPIGILNDDTNEVGQVHLGVIILVKGDNDNIQIKDEHKSGVMLTLDECLQIRHSMESWSQLCFDFIVQNQKLLQ